MRWWWKKKTEKTEVIDPDSPIRFSVEHVEGMFFCEIVHSSMYAANVDQDNQLGIKIAQDLFVSACCRIRACLESGTMELTYLHGPWNRIVRNRMVELKHNLDNIENLEKAKNEQMIQEAKRKFSWLI